MQFCLTAGATLQAHPIHLPLEDDRVHADVIKRKSGQSHNVSEAYIAPLGSSNRVSRGYRHISASLTVSLCLVAIFSFVIYFIYVYVCLSVCGHVHVECGCLKRPEEGARSPWIWSYVPWGAIMWKLGTQFQSVL